MAKKSKRPLMRNEKDHTGCMTGFISIFDFRQTRSTQKLLSDKTHASSRNSAGSTSSRSQVKMMSNSNSDKKDQDRILGISDLADGDGKKIMNVDFRLTTVKKIMENEIAGNGLTKDTADELLKPNSDHRNKSRKNRKQKNQALNVPFDTQACESLEIQDSHHLNQLNQSAQYDLAALVEEFCTFYEGDLCELQKSITSVLQEKTSEEAMIFLSEKFVNNKKPSNDGRPIHESKQFLDALEMLNSNKELLVKLLKDSDSVLVKHIRNLHATKSEKDEIEKPRHNFFRKKNRSHTRTPSMEIDDLQASNQIVILKPNLESTQTVVPVSSLTSSPHSLVSIRDQGHSGRFNSVFSLSEIKRKLKHAIGEGKNDRHLPTSTGIPVDTNISSKRQEKLDGNEENALEIAVREKKSLKPQIDFEKNPEPSTSNMSRLTGDISTDTLTNAHPRFSVGKLKKRESNIYLEAKNHLAEMLSNGSSPVRQTPRTLERILALSEYNSSPIFSPGKDRSGDSFVTAQIRFTPSGNLRVFGENLVPKPDKNASHQSPARLSSEILTCITPDTSLEIKLPELGLDHCVSEEILPDSEIQESGFSSGGDSSPKGGEEVVNSKDPDCVEETKFLDKTSESDSCKLNASSSTNKLNEEGPSVCFEQGSTIDTKPPSVLVCHSPPSSLQIQKVETLENMQDGPERPSPVSVLDNFLDEDVISPTSTTSQNAEMLIRPLHIDFDEDDLSTLVVTTSNKEDYLRACVDERISYFEFVKALLKASDIYSLDYPLDPSLLYEVDVLPEQLDNHKQLLFDCVNEVLAVLYDRYFGCSPWLKYTTPCIKRAPVGDILMNDVWEAIVCHLPSQSEQQTLDGIIENDMEKSRTWMDLRFDTEDCSVLIADEIVEELMEHTIFDLCS